MARNIPAFDLASYLTEVVGNLSPPAETSIPNIPVDLYDFLDALIHEFKLLKDMIPEIDP